MTKQKNETVIKDEFNDVINQLDHKFGEGTLQFLNNETFVLKPDQLIKSGSYYLDKALGVGGFPKGRIIEIFGAESSGKTTIALKAVAECQKKGEKAVYIDAEHALNFTYATQLGVDLNKMVLCQPNSEEQTFSIIEALIKTNLVNLIVVDSVAALTPLQELDGEFGDQTIGLQARIMSKGLRIIQNLLSNNVSIIFINQIRDKIGIGYMPGNATTTSGGRALKFFSSLRLETKKTELIKNADEPIGIRIKVNVVKNKLARPLTTALIDLYFGLGFDYNNEIIDVAFENGIIAKSGTWYSYKTKNIAQGKQATRLVILKDAKLFDSIKKEVMDQKLFDLPTENN